MRGSLLLCLALFGCQATEGEPDSERQRIDPALEFAFDELKAAVDGGEDEVARAILLRLRPRIQDPISEQVAEGYQRILGGRAVRDAVHAEVSVDEVEGGFAVSLELRQDSFDRLALTPGYMRIEWIAHGVDAVGRQSAQVGGRVLEHQESWVLPLGETLRVPLGVDSPKIGDGLLAVRCEWRVGLGAGSSVVGEERYPMMGMEVDDGRVVRLGKSLPTGPVPPEELVRYALGERVHTAALLERAVRIPPERYGETLDLLGASLAKISPARFEELVPIFAWLTGRSGMAATGEEWRTWLNDRRVRKEAGENLDLPERRGR